MTVREILQYPDPRLREVARQVGVFTPEVGELCGDLIQTLRYGSGGRGAIGLAATQIGVPLRVFVMETTRSGGKRTSYVCIDPIIQSASGELELPEGCLSFPADREVTIERSARIRLAYTLPSGLRVTRRFEGLLAVCAQHELDHLDGKLMVDYLEEHEIYDSAAADAELSA